MLSCPDSDLYFGRLFRTTAFQLKKYGTLFEVLLQNKFKLF